MLTLTATGQFRRDYKRLKKRGWNMTLLEEVIQTLLAEQPLPECCRDHGLIGNYAGFRECHVRPDWLLIYSVDRGRLILTASRTGAHAELLDR